MLELYYGAGTCSFVIHAGLEIIRSLTGTQYTSHRVKVHQGEQRTPQYLAVNPQGQVPVLVADGQPLTQVVAICDYLDRRFPEAQMLPTDPWERAQAMSQLAFMNNTAHPTFAHVFMSHHFGEGEAVQAELKRFNRLRFREHLERIQQWVPAGDPDGWFGGHPVFHDVYALTLLRWGGLAGIDPDSLPRLWAHSRRVAASAPVAATLVDERLELNVYRQPG
ncbi:glutathione S-transferase family protein [Variovorax terrae]|uniref:Glutathione S-transferase family protein n=1 Tax=Variovorax terrae TaxID=2923278 RepID=A0A9X2AN31_9BURK|nr:glutathione S-transferase family protein [Variovorax terrae]MCJ0763370.1 glutathione S-transferase family protein [Variovorax terrae]